MKRSDHVGWRKGIATWTAGNTLYLSVPFTWLLDDARKIAEKHDGRIVAGGPAVDLMGAPWATEAPKTCAFDTLSMHNPLATFTTRGCPNKCSFCAVPKIEGEFRELKEWKNAPIVCDNNLLAASRRHVELVMTRLAVFERVDFNQGLDARLFRPWHLDLLCMLNRPTVRFAFDHVSLELRVVDVIRQCMKRGLTPQCYVLIGCNDTPDDAKYRLETIRSLGLLPNPMRYQPLDAAKKNSYVAPGWTERQLRDYMRFYSMLGYWRTKTLEEYVETGGFGNRKIVEGGE